MHLKKVPSVIKSKYKFDLIKWFVEVIFKDFSHAKSSYENALAQNPENVVALRSLWVLYYNLGDYKKASAYLHKLDSISFFHIFQSNTYDIKRQKMLFKIDLRGGDLLWAARHLYRIPLFIARNSKILDKIYVL
jgi:tetratricopeptide (TPR) repeat protein